MGHRGNERLKLSELIQFLPKQQEAHQATKDHSYILYGGARGPGKSYWLRWELLLFVLYQYLEHKIEGVHAGLFCETYPELRDRQTSKIAKDFPPWLGEIKDTQDRGLGFHIKKQYGNGFIALRNLDDPSKYQSSEFAAIGVDELTKTPYETFTILRGSKRWPDVPRTLFLAATNPGGVGHLWVKRLWIDSDFPTELYDMREEYKFIQALPKDNPYLGEDYWRELNSLPEPLRSAWRDGDWEVFEGMAFSSWNKEVHVIPPFEIPDWWPVWRAVDWGYSAPFCCLWMTQDPDLRRIYVIREVYKTELTDRQQARLIKTLTPPGELIKLSYADPSMWSKKNLDGVVSSCEAEYRAEGIGLTKADNSRIDGKRRIDRLLGSLQDGQPGIQIFSTCENLIRTLPALPYSTKEGRAEDVDTHAEDHAYDALRYGLTNYEIAIKDRNRKQARSPMREMSRIL